MIYAWLEKELESIERTVENGLLARSLTRLTSHVSERE